MRSGEALCVALGLGCDNKRFLYKICRDTTLMSSLSHGRGEGRSLNGFNFGLGNRKFWFLRRGFCCAFIVRSSTGSLF